MVNTIGTFSSSSSNTPAALLDFAEQYCGNFPARSSLLHARSHEKEVVLVTGTTGNVGTDLLENLLYNDSVAMVYAINRRGTHTMERQRNSFLSRGYDETILDSSKFKMIEGDFDELGLGIEPQLLNEVQNSITWIIHNAWHVNFNMPATAFGDNLHALRRLIDIALSSPFSEPPKVQYVSSITVFQNYNARPPIEEEPMPASSALGSGYGESKWAGEHMLLRANEQTGLPVQIVRLAQICGNQNGYWNTEEWFPCIVKSSCLTRCLPDIDGDAAFVPNESAARALIDMHTSEERILHLAHPRPARLRALFESISEHLDVPLVSYDKWLQTLVESGKNLAADLSKEEYVRTARRNPALVLLGYFCARRFNQENEMVPFVRLSTEKARCASVTLEHLPELDKDMPEKWLAAWRACGFLDDAI